MSYEQSEQLVKNHISNTEDLFTFKGFDFGDKSWRGYISEEIEIDEGECLFFDGNVYFSIDSDGIIEYVEIEKINDFEHFDKDGESIQKFN